MIGSAFSVAEPIAHYVLSLALILFVVPKFLFVKVYSDGWERNISDALKMSAILMLLGYMLVGLKLFELISVAFLLIVIANRIYRIRQARRGLDDGGAGFEALIYDYFDGKYTLRGLAANAAKQQGMQWKRWLAKQFVPRTSLIGTLGFVTVLAVSTIVRMVPGVAEGALSYADRYSGIRWLKDVRENILFMDGVVPQGFHVFWATLQEFTRIDTLYVVQFTGPFTQLLVITGLYFFVSKLTGSRASGVVAMALYAFAGELIDANYWEWQLQSGPRTFVYAFLLPTVYFYLLYLRHAEKDALYTTLAGVAVVAFTDPAASIHLFIAVSFLTVYATLSKVKSTRASIGKVSLGWLVVTFASFLPLVIGLIAGRGIHLTLLQWFENYTAEGAFLLAPLPSLLPLITALAGGWLCYGLLRFIPAHSHRKLVEQALVLLVIGTGLATTTLRPAQATLVDWGSTIQTYAAISREYRANEWMVVSKDSLSAVTRGKGYHMNVMVLVENYDPSKASLTLNGSMRADLGVAPHVFIIYEKQLKFVNDPIAAERLKTKYKEWSQQMTALKGWLDQYEASNDSTTIYYEDEAIAVYYLMREEEPEEIKQKVRGGGE